MRDFVNKHGVIIFAVAIVLCALAWWFFGRTKAPNLSQAFFIDEENGEQMTLPLSEYPPRTNPKTGKQTMVEEFKFTCDGGKTTKVAYYIKYSEGTKKQLEKVFNETGKPSGMDVSNGTYVRQPTKDSKWVPMGSPDSSFTVITCPEGGNIESVMP